MPHAPILLLLAVLLLALPASLAQTPLAADSKAALERFDLAPGEARFWEGPYVERSLLADRGFAATFLGNPVPAQVSACALAGTTSCYRWELVLAEPGARLRVALDHPRREDQFRLELRDPSGALAAEAETSGFFPGGEYAAEAFVEAPEAGVWTVEVVPFDAATTGFRMRAKLEAEVPPPPPATPRLPLLPNLQVIPPHEPTFVAPAVSVVQWLTPERTNLGVAAAGAQPASCALEEALEGARRCLRFSAGLWNVGRGPLDLVLGPVEAPAAGNHQMLTGTMFQRVYFSDGTIEDVPAGAYEFHLTHGHNHYTDFTTTRLFRVVDARLGLLVPAGEERKAGFCLGDQELADWFQFDQAPRGTYNFSPQGCASPAGEVAGVPNPLGPGRFGFSPGWGDVYRWQRTGQYVEFAGQSDGLYVLQTAADDLGRVAESNETDNLGYALVRVEGSTVHVLERGFGASPWDAAKVVLDEYNHPVAG